MIVEHEEILKLKRKLEEKIGAECNKLQRCELEKVPEVRGVINGIKTAIKEIDKMVSQTQRLDEQA